jgi:hypothetical protein
VKHINSAVVEKLESDDMSFFAAVKINKRTNNFFVQLLKEWLVSDALA